MRRRSAAIALFLALTVVLGAVPSAEARRYRAYVSCGGGTFRPSHTCFGGDLPYTVFRDTVGTDTPFKVCVTDPLGTRRCKRRRATNNKPRQVPFSADNIGTYTVRWGVHGKRVRTWRFYLASEGV